MSISKTVAIRTASYIKLHPRGILPKGLRRNPDKPFQVIVGNIGQVYDGSNFMEASAHFAEYVRQSKTGRGRAGGESVTLMHKGEIKREFVGTVDAPDWQRDICPCGI